MGDGDVTYLLHLLLTFLLALEKLPLARHITTVALRGHILTIRLHPKANISE